MPTYDTGVDKITELGTEDGSSPRESYGPDECMITKKYRCRTWAQRRNAVRKFLGFSKLTRSGDPVTGPITGLSRSPAVVCPDAPEMIAMRINSVTGHRFSTSRTTAEEPATSSQFDAADLEVQFESVAFRELPDEQVTPATEWHRRCWVSGVQPSAEFLSLPGGSLAYVKPDGTSFGAIPFNVGKILPQTTFEVTWSYLPVELFAPAAPTNWQKRIWGDGTTEPMIGRINKESMFNDAFPAGTMLLTNAFPILRRHPTIDASWDIRFLFEHKADGWNSLLFYAMTSTSPAPTGRYFVGPKDGGYHAPGTVPPGGSLYDEVDLMRVFDVRDTIP